MLLIHNRLYEQEKVQLKCGIPFSLQSGKKFTEQLERLILIPCMKMKTLKMGINTMKIVPRPLSQA